MCQGPYIAGEKPTDSDYALIPKLHHMRIAFGYYYNFQIPARFTALHKYIDVSVAKLHNPQIQINFLSYYSSNLWWKCEKLFLKIAILKHKFKKKNSYNLCHLSCKCANILKSSHSSFNYNFAYCYHFWVFATLSTQRYLYWVELVDSWLASDVKKQFLVVF